MTTLYSSVFLVCGLAYILAHGVILPRHDSIMTLYDGYYLDYYSAVHVCGYDLSYQQYQCWKTACPWCPCQLWDLSYRISGSLFQVKVKVTASYP